MRMNSQAPPSGSSTQLPPIGVALCCLIALVPSQAVRATFGANEPTRRAIHKRASSRDGDLTRQNAMCILCVSAPPPPPARAYDVPEYLWRLFYVFSGPFGSSGTEQCIAAPHKWPNAVCLSPSSHIWTRWGELPRPNGAHEKLLDGEYLDRNTPFRSSLPARASRGSGVSLETSSIGMLIPFLIGPSQFSPW